jgi:hypothetical protein
MQTNENFFLAYPSIWKKKLGVVAHFRAEICKNHRGRNVGKEKQKSTCFGIFLQNSPISKLWILFQLKFPHCIFSTFNQPDGAA